MTLALASPCTHAASGLQSTNRTISILGYAYENLELCQNQV